MNRKRIHILIVDDDPTQGKALLEAFKRTGYQATWVGTSVQALTQVQRQDFQGLFVDCMLPKMNGVDLVEEIQQLSIRPQKVFLFSGIFKDKNFQKEATERTRCEAFFTKPLDLDEVLTRVDDAFRAELEQSAEPFAALYSETPPTDAELIRFMNDQSSMHAFHLPMLIKHMLKSHLQGELTLVNSQGDVSSLSFHDGALFGVHTPDKESYFGSLAVGLGWVSYDDVLSALRSNEKKRIGQKLIDSFSLSPHAIHMIMEEQLALRLSQCVRDEIVTIQWTSHGSPPPDFALNPNRYTGLLEDWLRSKIEPSFIKGTFQNWLNSRIEGVYHPTIRHATSVADFFSNSDFEEDRDLPFAFAQLLRRQAFIGAAADGAERDFSYLEARLDQMLASFKTQNHFQIMGVGEKSKMLELNRSFDDFKSHFDPMLLPEECPAAVRVKCTQVFAHVEKVYKTLSDDVERSRYLTSLQNQRAQTLLENEPIFRAAIVELHGGQAKAAARKFQSLLDQKMEFRDLRAYRIWAGLKIDRSYRDLSLDQIPPEERHSVAYHMAKGLHLRIKGNLQKAMECFRTAHVLDPRQSVARHELKVLATYLDKNRTANRDLFREVTQVLEGITTKARRGA